MALAKSKYIDLSVAPWTMHEFFAGSGLVGYGLQGMFAPIWANDISEQKAAVYTANFGDEHFWLDDIKSNDDSYKKLYVDNADLELFYRSASLGKKVEHFIKSSNEYSQAAKSDILFYTLYAVVALAVHSADITPTAFKELDLSVIDDAKISEAARMVFDVYTKLGGSNKVAKGNDLLEGIRTCINNYESPMCQMQR